jgi:hypothetical protein
VEAFNSTSTMKLKLKVGKIVKPIDVEQPEPVFNDIAKIVSQNEGYVLSSVIVIARGKRYRSSFAHEAQTRLSDAGTLNLPSKPSFPIVTVSSCLSQRCHRSLSLEPTVLSRPSLYFLARLFYTRVVTVPPLRVLIASVSLCWPSDVHITTDYFFRG